MTVEKLAREERRVRVEGMLCAERGAAYEVAFHASVAAVVRFAVEQAGMRGMTKAVHQSLKELPRRAYRRRCAPWRGRRDPV